MTQPPDLIALADRCERAEGPVDYPLRLFMRKRIIEAWDAINPVSMCWDFDEGEAHTNARCRLVAMLEAEAYESAALTLAPAGSLWAFGSMEDGPFARLLWPHPDGTYTGNYVETKAAAPALALTAAALRAHTAQDPRP